LPPGQAELIQRASDAHGLLCLLTDKVDRSVIEALPKLKVISNMAVGVDNIDIKVATEHRIPVGNTPDVLTDATADMTFALLMACARRIVEADHYVRAGKWKTWGPQLLLGADFSGATLGLIGFGRIGVAVAQRARGFNLKVIYYDPSAKPKHEAIPVGMEQILREADFISLHVPLTTETRHMITSDTLSKCKNTVILINTSRGGIIDQEALYDVLKNHRILAAALDVTEPEPLPANHPLLTLDNCLVTPHIASASQRTREKMALMAAQNLIAGLHGEKLPNCVNPEVYT